MPVHISNILLLDPETLDLATLKIKSWNSRTIPCFQQLGSAVWEVRGPEFTSRDQRKTVVHPLKLRMYSSD